MTNEMQEQIIQILSEIQPGVDYALQSSLIEDHILDSMDVVQLASRLDEQFDVEITPVEIVPENFRSAADICRMVERLIEEG